MFHGCVFGSNLRPALRNIFVSQQFVYISCGSKSWSIFWVGISAHANMKRDSCCRLSVTFAALLMSFVRRRAPCGSYIILSPIRWTVRSVASASILTKRRSQYTKQARVVIFALASAVRLHWHNQCLGPSGANA